MGEMLNPAFLLNPNDEYLALRVTGQAGRYEVEVGLVNWLSGSHKLETGR